MNRFRQLAAKMATILLTTVPLLTAAVPLSAQAAEDTEKTVRVGYVNALNYEDVDAIVAPDLATDYDYLAISSIGYSEFY